MSKFLNISTDNTLGGNSASDDTVSSQKAVKEYVDSQTGTAPAFANITGQPTDNANLATALNNKQDTLVSGTNIKTINNTSILGSGNIDIQGGGSYTAGDGIDITNNVISVDGVTTSEVTLATVATTGAYSDLSGTPTIPTVNNATLTIQKNGSNVATFTANASSNVTANISVPTDTGDLTNNAGYITGISSSDVTSALGYTPVNPTSLATVATSGSYNDLSNKPTIPSVDQTYSSSSANAQSGVAINGAKFLRNTATNTESLTIYGDSSNRRNTINIGAHSSPTGVNSVMVGAYSQAGEGAFAIGNGATAGNYSLGLLGSATANYAYQIGRGTNTETNSLYVGWNSTNNYKLLGSDGLIPDDRLNTTIARTSAIPTVNNATLTITQGGTSKGTFTANASSDVTIALDSGGGASRNIGEIVQSTIPLTDAGLHLLDGSLVSSGSYADFVTYIAGLVSNYPDLFTTEANWQTSVTNYGVCGKFVYDSVNNTVRLPKVTGFIEGASGVANLGELTLAGLPNITGTVPDPLGGGGGTWTGAFARGSSNGSASTSQIDYDGYDISFDASRSSAIYGRSNTVQPQSIKVLYYIVIATSTKTDIEVDIDEIATDLNGKADIDLGNCTAPHIVETYTNGTSGYRVWSDGYCEQWGWIDQGSTPAWTTVDLLQVYKDTNYSVVCSQLLYNVADAKNAPVITCKNSNSQISVTCYNNAAKIGWQACGYIS